MSQFTPRQVLQRQMLFYPIFGAAGIVAAWAWWAFQAFVKTPDPKATVNDAALWLGIAAVLTVAVPIGLAWTLLQTRVLLQRGKMATARLAEVGGAISNGQQVAKFQYVVDGKTYTSQIGVDTVKLNAFSPDTTVPVIYDPQKPSRAQVFGHMADVAVDEPSVVKEVVTDTLDYLIYGGLLVGQTVGLMMLVTWVAKPYTAAMIGPAVFGALALTMLEFRIFETLRGASGAGNEANRKWRDRWMIVMAVIAIGWGIAAGMYGRNDSDDQTVIDQREADSARERAERAKIDRDSREAMEKLRAIQEKRNAAASQPAGR